MPKETGFITPDNQIILLNYDEVYKFCMDVCELEENYENWQHFKKDYNYFSSCFDFLILKLNYIFINPLYQMGTYLKSVKNKMFIINEKDLDVINYDSISQTAKQKYNGGNYSDIVPCSNHELNIEKLVIDSVKAGNWLIDPNGYALMSKSDIEQGNHETTANTILNQLLITNPEVLKLLDDRQYAVSLLVEHFGFIRTVTYDDYSILIGHEKILPDILVLIKDTILQDGTSVFYDLGTESKNLPLKLKMYSIQLDERTGYNG
ncbi:MAG: hypothetical protein MRZ42_05450 [Tenericutes bacterium]|nr:hypothetical protein [Mycoplasmatota bacterium]